MQFKRIAAVLMLAVAQFDAEVTAQTIAEPTEKIITDHTRRYSQGDNVTVITWLSQSLWADTANAPPAMGERTRAALLKMTEPYLIFLIADGKYLPFGGTHFFPESLVRGTFRIKDGEGRLYAPLPESEVSYDLRILSDRLQPPMVRTFGAFGKGTKLLVFDNRDADGKPIANPYEPGTLKLVSAQREFVYQLPLASALPPKVDAKTGEKFPGTYKFNPYTGEPLPP